MSKYENYTKDQLIKYIDEIEKQLKSNKYGLNWNKSIDEEDERIKIRTSLPILLKKSIDISTILSTNNILIEGDNLISLTLLNMINSQEGIIDVVYIDPPYNTGKNDFSYNDKYVDNSDSYRHSKWLNFMEKRLTLSKNLLKDNGVVFISIDDNEFAQLKLLCDQIFSEKNYIGDIIWNSTKSVTNTAIISVSHTYNLIYAKNIDYWIKNRNKFRVSANEIGFSNPDNDPRGPWKADPFQVGGWRPNQQYEIENPKTGKIYLPNKGSSWKNDFDKYLELKNDNRIVFGKKGTSGPQRKRFLSEALERGRVVKTIWDDVETTTNGTQTLKKIFNGESPFSNPKPVGFIKKIIDLATDSKNDATILDFFAGSGTTGQAVLELNQEDGGNRRFILCTNNENNICTDVTYPRLKTVITGVRSDGSKYSDGIPANLHYYKTDFIPHNGNADQSKYDLVEKVNHLLCISENVYNLIDQSEKHYIYGSSDGTKEVFMYIDYYDKVSFDKFLAKIQSSQAKEKIVYVFSTDNTVDEKLFEDIKGIVLKPIPSKMYEIYKEIVEDIKRG